MISYQKPMWDPSTKTVRNVRYTLGIAARVMGNVAGESTGACKYIYRLFSESTPNVCWGLVQMFEKHEILEKS